MNANNPELLTRRRRLSPNGRVYRKLAGNFPHFILMEDGSVDQMTHEERAFLRFRRILPDDLRAELDAAFELDGDAKFAALKAFNMHCDARRADIAWPVEDQS